jgi:hypothetical protein
MPVLLMLVVCLLPVSQPKNSVVAVAGAVRPSAKASGTPSKDTMMLASCLLRLQAMV